MKWGIATIYDKNHGYSTIGPMTFGRQRGFIMNTAAETNDYCLHPIPRKMITDVAFGLGATPPDIQIVSGEVKHG